MFIGSIHKFPQRARSVVPSGVGHKIYKNSYNKIYNSNNNICNFNICFYSTDSKQGQYLKTRKKRINMSIKTEQKEWTPEEVVPERILKLLKPDGSGKNYNYANAFYQIVSLLKEQKRTGWINFDIPNPESIADHMYRMSIIAMSLSPASFGDHKPDISKCVKIALVHDIAESLVGDITPTDANIDKVEKNKREYKTILYLSDVIRPYNEDFSKELVDLWLDYEEQRCFEAVITKDIDKYELLIQTLEYEKACKGEKNLNEFFSCRKAIKTKEIKDLADVIMNDREKFWESVKKQN